MKLAQGNCCWARRPTAVPPESALCLALGELGIKGGTETTTEFLKLSSVSAAKPLETSYLSRPARRLKTQLSLWAR